MSNDVLARLQERMALSEVIEEPTVTVVEPELKGPAQYVFYAGKAGDE